MNPPPPEAPKTTRQPDSTIQGSEPIPDSQIGRTVTVGGKKYEIRSGTS